MSLSKPSSRYQDAKKSGNRRGFTSSNSTPVACRVCDRVFSDNVSLVLHFAGHLKDGNRRDFASLQSDRGSSSSLPPFCFPSALKRTNHSHHVVSPWMNSCFKPCPLPFPSAITPNLAARGFSQCSVCVPVLNSTPPINASFDARCYPPQPVCHSTPSHCRACSSVLVNPFTYSRFCLREHNVRQIKKLEKPIREIIFARDNKELDDKNSAEIDLVLKL